MKKIISVVRHTDEESDTNDSKYLNMPKYFSFIIEYGLKLIHKLWLNSIFKYQSN